MMNQKSNELSLTVKDLLIEIHRLTLQLSKLEFATERRTIEHPSVSSADTAFVLTAGRKQFKYEFFKYLVNVHAPHHHFHLETMFAAGALTNENLYTALNDKIERLYGIINGFRQSEDTMVGDCMLNNQTKTLT
jgi:hypothetical protein